MPDLTVSFRNVGSEPIVIVRPVCWCESGGRKVQYRWSVSKDGTPVPRMGFLHEVSIASLTSADFMTIPPGESREVKTDEDTFCTIGDYFCLDTPGTYDAILTYSFDPTLVEKIPNAICRGSRSLRVSA